MTIYSKSGQNLTRYFPEVVAGARILREKSSILDGEIMVPVGGQFSFDDLLRAFTHQIAILCRITKVAKAI